MCFAIKLIPVRYLLSPLEVSTLTVLVVSPSGESQILNPHFQDSPDETSFTSQV